MQLPDLQGAARVQQPAPVLLELHSDVVDEPGERVTGQVSGLSHRGALPAEHCGRETAVQQTRQVSRDRLRMGRQADGLPLAPATSRPPERPARTYAGTSPPIRARGDPGQLEQQPGRVRQPIAGAAQEHTAAHGRAGAQPARVDGRSGEPESTPRPRG